MGKRINKSFDQTLLELGISASRVAEASGVGKSQISLFRSGKRNVTSETLEALLDAVDELHPGARRYFCSILARESLTELDIKSHIRQMGTQEIVALLKELADRLSDQQEQGTTAKKLPISA